MHIHGKMNDPVTVEGLRTARSTHCGSLGAILIVEDDDPTQKLFGRVRATALLDYVCQ